MITENKGNRVLDALGNPVKHLVMNSKGDAIILTKEEQIRCNALQKQLVENALGAEINVTTLTTIIKKVSEQKHFQVRPSLYLPVKVGEGSWSSNLVTYREYSTGGDFSEGILNTGKNSDLASTDTAVDAVSVPVYNWAKMNKWNIMELNQALKAGSWDLVEAKERSRKRNYDLGVQGIAFLGNSDLKIKGLLSLTGVTTDNATIAKKLSKMTAAELVTFCSVILGVYRANCAHTAWPTHFQIPESDYLGLAAPSDAQFHIKSKLAVLLETFRVMTGNENFQILPLAYADKANNKEAKYIYSLYNYDDASIRMDVPVEYTPTTANTINGFEFQNVAYSQFTGAEVYRPKEFMYFKHAVD